MSYLIVDQDGTQKEDTIDPFPKDEIPDLSQTYEKDIPIITLESPTEKGTDEWGHHVSANTFECKLEIILFVTFHWNNFHLLKVLE